MPAVPGGGAGAVAVAVARPGGGAGAVAVTAASSSTGSGSTIRRRERGRGSVEWRPGVSSLAIELRESDAGSAVNRRMSRSGGALRLSLGIAAYSPGGFGCAGCCCGADA